MVGLFDRRPNASPDLLAYALSDHHGDHVEYAVAASTRNTHLKMPLSYGLAWDLMQWGKATGALWFEPLRTVPARTIERNGRGVEPALVATMKQQSDA